MNSCLLCGSYCGPKRICQTCRRRVEQAPIKIYCRMCDVFISNDPYTRWAICYNCRAQAGHSSTL